MIEPRARKLTEEDLALLGRVARAVFAAEPDVIALYLYGSAARGEPAHDLDLAILTRGHASHAQLEKWAAVLQRDAAPQGPEIDLRPVASAAPRFRATVVREGKLLFEGDERLRRAFEHRALVEWFDYEPVWLRARARMLARLSDG